MRFDAERGYGFIKPDNGGPDLFMHVSELDRSIDPHAVRPNTRVSFEEDDTGRGPKAVRVAVLDVIPASVPAQQPAPATVAAWHALWDKVAASAFESLMEQVRANGWVQD
jgi:cold shock CspA family protein